MLEHIRADEACHRELNHHFADIPAYGKVDYHTLTVDDNAKQVNEDEQKKEEDKK
jgi:hypothetical protein